MNTKKSTIIITGASSGIGQATAHILAKNEYNLILLARRQDRLAELKAELLKENPKLTITTHALDVRDQDAIKKFVNENETDLRNTCALVNSAGLASGVDKMQDANPSDWDTMIDTNIKGSLYLTRAVLPFMIKNRSGDIINLGSVAGRWVYPGGGVYCATKFAVRALSEGLRLDLMGTGIRVTNIEPGMVETEFSEVRLQDKILAKKVYAGMKPLSADDIAQSILWCLGLPKHVNIQELVIFPTDQPGVGYVHRR